MKKPLSSLTKLSILCFLFSLTGTYGFSDDNDDAFRSILEARRIARTGRYFEALEKFRNSITFAEETGQKLIIAIALNNIAEIYRLHGNTAEALKFYRQALATYTDIGNQNGVASTRKKIDEILLQPGEAGEFLVGEREKRIREAIERVRDRVRGEQETGGSYDTKKPEYAAYLDGVRKAVVRAWGYSEGASQIKEWGRVEVEFTILRDGQLETVRIARSSGHPSMDREAIRAVEAAAPFRRIPEQLGLKQINIDFTFNYIPGKTQERSEKRN